MSHKIDISLFNWVIIIPQSKSAGADHRPALKAWLACKFWTCSFKFGADQHSRGSCSTGSMQPRDYGVVGMDLRPVRSGLKRISIHAGQQVALWLCDWAMRDGCIDFLGIYTCNKVTSDVAPMHVFEKIKNGHFFQTFNVEPAISPLKKF